MSSTGLSDRWFYKVENAKRGPVSGIELREKILSQELSVETPVWRDGMETFASARHVVALFPDGLVPIYSSQPEAPAQRSSPMRSVLYGCAGLGLLGLAGSQLFSGKGTDPYTYRRVSGDVLYEDGQVIPVRALQLTFVPLAPPINPRLNPRPGFAIVDVKTGAFISATSRKPGDGIVQGTHKVLLSGENRMPLPEDLIPAEYANFKTTPLEVDTKTGTLHLKVKKPEAVKKPSEPK
jgi:hypothetical protein